MRTSHDPQGPPPSQFELWSLREDVIVDTQPGDTTVRLRGQWGEFAVQQPSRVVREALSRMRLGPISLENVMSGLDGGGAADAQREELQRVLDQLQPLVIRSLRLESGQPLLSVVPTTVRSAFCSVPVAQDVPIRLSVYAAMRIDRSVYRLESPLALHRVLLHRPEAVMLVASLASPVTPATITASMPLPRQVTAAALAYLVAAGMVIQADTTSGGPPAFTEDNAPDLLGWSPADLTFHVESTLGRHDHDLGRTYPSGHFAPLDPVVKPPAAESVPLHRPRWEELCAADPSLTAAIEGRRSVRRHDARPITSTELGELLYRTARVRSVTALERDGNGEPEAEYELSDRPYPSAGACYELELYATAGECEGLDPGVYHYDPLGHRLEPVKADRAAVDEILRYAQRTALMSTPAQLVILVTARFRRTSWKYEGLAYRLVLMHVGVLMQSLYLVCTAMRLAPCALGSVSITAAARALGTDWRVEPCVGQFIVGREPDVPGDDNSLSRNINDAQWMGLARDKVRAAAIGRQDDTNRQQGKLQPLRRPGP